jgi:hypothetical protein
MRFRTSRKRKFALFFIRLSYRDHDFSPLCMAFAAATLKAFARISANLEI